jgi:predicted nuclease with TOPRIM domain
MTSLPPVPADRLATKGDIERLDDKIDRLENRFDVLEGRFDRLEERFDRLEDRIDRMSEQFIALSRDMHLESVAMHDRMHEQFRNYSILTIGSMTALTGVFAVVVGLIT